MRERRNEFAEGVIMHAFAVGSRWVGYRGGSIPTEQGLSKSLSLSICWLLYSTFMGQGGPKSADQQSENCKLKDFVSPCYRWSVGGVEAEGLEDLNFGLSHFD